MLIVTGVSEMMELSRESTWISIVWAGLAARGGRTADMLT
jgi:hypothetical protein